MARGSYGKQETGFKPIWMEEDTECRSPAAWASVAPCKKAASVYF